VTDYTVCKAKSGASQLSGACAKIQDMTTANAFASGDQVQITIKYNDQIPAIGTLFGAVSIPITSSATMMIENTPTGSQLTWLTGGSTTLTC
jgi:hypothetical protein